MEPLQPGVIIDGRFRVETVLGRGATSMVYAVSGPSGDELALKRLTRSTRSAELSLRREYQTLARLAHPNIVSVRELGRDGDVPYYTMERIAGPTLEEAPRPGVREACVILRDLASALSLLHARRLVHRDLSARNVRLGRDGAPKLLDFGTLATMGVGFDIAGTPPHVAPETLRRLPVDGRADVYGLGALGYFLLARRHAYPATGLADLERAWQTPPPKLRAQRDDVPAPLEALILSMLSIDPLGRPVSAAEVMDRLAGIAGIERDDTEREEEAWMQGAVLVGREREATILRDALREVARGRVRTALVEAPSGLGKTRLLQEAALDAQLVGAVALRARGDAAELGPFGVLRAIAAEAIRVCPSESIAAARGREEVVAAAVPELSGGARHERTPETADPNESRLRLQQALLGWFRDLSRARPVVVLIDDLQRCDEASAALLAALARSTEDAAIGIFAALRIDEAIRAPEPIAALSEAATHLALAPLGREETLELVTTWFGDLPERERLADYLRRRGGGSPLHTIELVRFLRERRILEYRQGRWRLGGELPETDLPAGLAETLSMRVRSLGKRARKLGEALAVHAGTMSLELCVGAWEGEEDEAIGVLDELVFEEVLVGSADELWFRHDGLREAFLRALSPARLEELHRRAADVLLSLGSLGVAEREAQIGWHLLHGGRRLAASDHLARAGRDLYEAHSFREAIAPLRAALEILETQRAPPSELLQLRLMLIRAGTVCDREVLLEHVDGTLAILLEASGMRFARRVSTVLGPTLGLFLGVAWRSMRRLLTPRPRRLPPPVASLVTLMSIVNFAASARSLAFEVDALRRLVALLEPLEPLRVPRMASALARSFLDMALGSWGEVRERSTWLLSILEHERVPMLADIDQRMAIGAARYMRAAVDLLDQDPDYRAELEALEKLDLRFFDVATNAARLLYHRLRGEEDVAERHRARHETWRVQLGSAWAFDSQIAWMSAIAYGLSSDLPGLERSAAAVEGFLERGYQLGPFAALVRGDYLRERGDVAGARRVLEAAFGALSEEEALGRQLLAGALSDACLADGDPEAAHAAADRGLEVASDRARGTRTARARCGRARALALDALGRSDEAVALLDALLEDVGPSRSPTLCGMLHEARARIARSVGDRAAQSHHRAELERLWRSSENPALVARWERFAREMS